MKKLNLAFTIIMETWLYDCEALNTFDSNALYGHAVSFVHRNRKKKKRSNPGGGVSIAFRRSLITLKEFKFARKNYEILCAHGKIKNNTRPLYVFGVYLCPKCKAAHYHECLTLISDAILTIKTEVRESYFAIGGDLNCRDIQEAIGDYEDVSIIATTATRGEATRDVAACNFNDSLISATVNSPLQTAGDACASNHSFVAYNFCLRHRHNFEWVRYSVRQISDAAITRYDKQMSNQDWSFSPAADVSQIAAQMHARISAATDECFPYLSLIHI